MCLQNYGAHEGGLSARPGPLSKAQLSGCLLIHPVVQVYRQDHPAFISTLAKIRRGICDDECVAFLKTCGTELGRGGNIKIQVRHVRPSRGSEQTPEIDHRLLAYVRQPTNLYPIRSAVENENRREFEKLREEAYTFQALDDARGGYARTVMAERVRICPSRLFMANHSV